MNYFRFTLFVSFLFSAFSASNAQAPDFWKSSKIDTSVKGAVTALVFANDGSLISATQGSGLFRSTDYGNSWEQLHCNLPSRHFYCLGKDKDGTIYAGTYNGYAYRTHDNGASWEAVLIDSSRFDEPEEDTARSFISTFLFSREDYIFAGTAGSGVVRSTDHGATWQKVNRGLSWPHVFSLVQDPHGCILAGTYGCGVFETTDNGQQWTRAGDLGIFIDRVNSLTMDAHGEVYAGSDQGIWKDSTVYDTIRVDTLRKAPLTVERQIDTGRSWRRFNTGIRDTVIGGYNDIYILSVVITPDSQIFASSFGGGIYRSRDNAGSWSKTNSGLSELNIRTLIVSDSGYVFGAGDSGAIFRSSQRFPSVQAIDIPRQSLASSVEHFTQSVFNPTTTFPITITEAGYVSLVVYDSLGNEVQTLINGDLKKGDYEIRWDSSNLSAGSYLYRLQSAHVSKIGKLILVK
jgi:photosystem II stability/assembly factor-like uncharacterized protein